MIFYETTIKFNKYRTKNKKVCKKNCHSEWNIVKRRISKTFTYVFEILPPYGRLNDNTYNIRNNIGTIIPIINRIPPRPQKPFEPFTITRPVKVIRIRQTANTSLKVVHQRPGL